jgi:hypothetical protein
VVKAPGTGMAHVPMHVGFVVAIAAAIAVPAAIAVDVFVYVNVNASIDFKRFQKAILDRSSWLYRWAALQGLFYALCALSWKVLCRYPLKFGMSA